MAKPLVRFPQDPTSRQRQMAVPQCLLLSYTHILIVLPYVEPTVSIIASLLTFNVVFNSQSVIILHFLLTWNL